MKVYSVSFRADCGAKNDSITVGTLKEIHFPCGAIHLDRFPAKARRKFLEDSFRRYLEECLRNDRVPVFNSFSEIEFAIVSELFYPMV